MRHLKQLPLWRDANRLLLEVEQAVRVFPRYHKYTLGMELRPPHPAYSRVCPSQCLP